MITLQILWFVLVFVLFTGYAVLDGFDLGTGFWYSFLPSKESKKEVVEYISPFWDGNEVWLLTGGGALFAAFPPVYAATFSGFYMAMMLVMFGLFFRALGIEFGDNVENEKWIKGWGRSFAIGSILPSILFGVAIGNVVRGIPLDTNGDYTATFFHLLNPFSLLFGVASLAMFATHGAAFIRMKNREIGNLLADFWSWIVYLSLFITLSIWSIINYRQTVIWPPVVFMVLGVVSIVGIKLYRDKSSMMSFLSSAFSIVFTMSFIGSIIFPYLVPTPTMVNALSIFNSSSSYNTLTVMSVMALVGMPMVIGYTAFIYSKLK